MEVGDTIDSSFSQSKVLVTLLSVTQSSYNLVTRGPDEQVTPNLVTVTNGAAQFSLVTVAEVNRQLRYHVKLQVNPTNKVKVLCLAVGLSHISGSQ